MRNHCKPVILLLCFAASASSQNSPDSAVAKGVPRDGAAGNTPSNLYFSASASSHPRASVRPKESGASGSDLLLVDDFSQDTALNASLWSPATPLMNSVAQSLSATLLKPELSFGSPGMTVSGVTGLWQFTGVQSNQSFAPPFAVQFTVEGTVATGNPFSFFLVSGDLSGSLYVDGNLNANNIPYYGINTPSGILYASPMLDAWYTVSIAVDALGSASILLTDTAGDVLGSQAGIAVGTQPLYLVLGQYEGYPNIPPGPDTAIWQSIEVLGVASGAPEVTAVNAASYASAPMAVNSIVAAFGLNLTTETASASGTLSTTLGGTSVLITDSTGTALPGDLFYVSPTQINLLIPPTLASGLGQIQVTSADGTVSVSPLQITKVAPGLFATPNSLAVGYALQVDAAGNQTTQDIVQYNAIIGQFQAVPINLGASTNTTYLVLYGTGIRNAPLSQVSVSIGGMTVAPGYAGAQPTFVGLDQVNLEIPSSLGAAGDVAITLTAAGITSNAVHVTIQ